ncbi:MAG: hypothetical protein ACREUZ_02475 [Burkholderiales bacterium]
MRTPAFPAFMRVLAFMRIPGNAHSWHCPESVPPHITRHITRHITHHITPHITKFITQFVTGFEGMDSTIRFAVVVRASAREKRVRAQYRSRGDDGIQIGIAVRHGTSPCAVRHASRHGRSPRSSRAKCISL